MHHATGDTGGLLTAQSWKKAHAICVKPHCYTVCRMMLYIVLLCCEEMLLMSYSWKCVSSDVKWQLHCVTGYSDLLEFDNDWSLTLFFQCKIKSELLHAAVWLMSWYWNTQILPCCVAQLSSYISLPSNRIFIIMTLYAIVGLRDYSKPTKN